LTREKREKKKGRGGVKRAGVPLACRLGLPAIPAIALDSRLGKEKKNPAKKEKRRKGKKERPLRSLPRPSGRRQARRQLNSATKERKELEKQGLEKKEGGGGSEPLRLGQVPPGHVHLLLVDIDVSLEERRRRGERKRPKKKKKKRGSRAEKTKQNDKTTAHPARSAVGPVMIGRKKDSEKEKKRGGTRKVQIHSQFSPPEARMSAREKKVEQGKVRPPRDELTADHAPFWLPQKRGRRKRGPGRREGRAYR